MQSPTELKKEHTVLDKAQHHVSALNIISCSELHFLAANFHVHYPFQGTFKHVSHTQAFVTAVIFCTGYLDNLAERGLYTPQKLSSL